MSEKDIFLEILSEHSAFFEYKKDLEKDTSAFQKSIDLYFERDHIFDIQSYNEYEEVDQANMFTGPKVIDDKKQDTENTETTKRQERTIFAQANLKNAIFDVIGLNAIDSLTKYFTNNQKLNADEKFDDMYQKDDAMQFIKNSMDEIINDNDTEKMISDIKEKNNTSLSNLAKLLFEKPINQQVMNEFNNAERSGDKQYKEFIKAAKSVANKIKEALSQPATQQSNLITHIIRKLLNDPNTKSVTKSIFEKHTTKEEELTRIKAIFGKITGLKNLNVDETKAAGEFATLDQAIKSLQDTNKLTAVNTVVKDVLSSVAQTLDARLAEAYKSFRSERTPREASESFYGEAPETTKEQGSNKGGFKAEFMKNFKQAAAKTESGIKTLTSETEKKRNEATRMTVAFSTFYIFAVVMETINDHLTKAIRNTTVEEQYLEGVLDAIAGGIGTLLNAFGVGTMPLSFVEAASKFDTLIPKIIDSMKTNTSFLKSMTNVGLDNIANKLNKQVFSVEWLKENTDQFNQALETAKNKAATQANNIDTETLVMIIKQVYQPTETEKIAKGVEDFGNKIIEKVKW